MLLAGASRKVARPSDAGVPRRFTLDERALLDARWFRLRRRGESSMRREARLDQRFKPVGGVVERRRFVCQAILEKAGKAKIELKSTWVGIPTK